MSINTSIWGSTFIDDLKGCAKTTPYSMWQYLTRGAIPLNQLPDDSACYCGMYYDNYIINAKSFKPDKTAVKVFKSPGAVNSWFFMRNYTNPIAVNMEFTSVTGDPMYNKWMRWANPATMPDYYQEYNNYFLFNLKLNKLLFVPYVVCSANNSYSADVSVYTLAAYAAAEHVSKPYINGVYMVAYYNHGTAETPNWQVAYESTQDFIFHSPVAEFTDDFKSIFADNDFDASFSIFTTLGSDPAHTYIPVMGFGANASRSLSRYPIGLDPNTTHYVYNTNTDPTNIKYCMPYSADNLKLIYKQIAYYGVFFLGDGAGDFQNVALTSNRVFCGTIEDGITYGRYTRGTDNAQQAQFTWTDTSQSPYDPSSVDPVIYDGSMDIYSNISVNTITNRYAMSALSYTQITSKLWDALAGVPQGEQVTEYGLDMFLTSDPIDSIVSLKYFPVSCDTGTAVHVYLGKYDTDISAYKAKNIIEYPCGSIPITARGNWTDYETQIMLYLPFCGTVQIDPQLYMGRDVYVDYIIDCISGNCSAAVYVYADNGNKCIIEIANGNCAIDLPVTGIQQTTLDAQIFNASEQIKQMRINNNLQEIGNIFGMMQNLMSGNVVGTAAAGVNAAQDINRAVHSENVANYELQHMQVPLKMIGTTGPLTGYCMELAPTLIFIRPTRPADLDNDVYAHTIGYAQCKPCTVGSVSGYAEFTNVDLSGFSATVQEKQIIANALGSGIYV